MCGFLLTVITSDMGDKPTPEKDAKTGRFLPGNSGNGGRPKGAKSKLSETFLKDMLSAWETGGKTVIEDVMRDKPDVFLRTVASLVPKEMNLNVTDNTEDMTDDEIKQELAEIADALAAVGIVATGKGTNGKAGEKSVH